MSQNNNSGDAFIGFIMFAVEGIVRFADMRAMNSLRNQGKTGQATIIRQRTENPNTTIVTGSSQQRFDAMSTPRSQYRNYVTYQYTVNGTLYSSEERVSESTYHILTPNTTTEVVYSPTNPKRVRLASKF
jgi:hypothetical protein